MDHKEAARILAAITRIDNVRASYPDRVLAELSSLIPESDRVAIVTTIAIMRRAGISRDDVLELFAIIIDEIAP